MSKLLTLVAAAFLVACQHTIVEPIHPIPTVDVRIDVPKRKSVKVGALPQDHGVFLYHNFGYPYLDDPINIHAKDNTALVSLLPGPYRAVVHSLPIEPLVLTGIESFETPTVTLPVDEADELLPCPPFYALRTQDPMKSIEIVREAEGENALVFNPILITKRIKIRINTSNFGKILSARGVLSGVASALNLTTFRTSMGRTIPFQSIDVQDDELTIEAFDVLGFTTEEPEGVVLKLFVGNDEVDFELEQPVDLTQELKKLPEEGGEVHIDIDLRFNPDIRVHPVTIRQWDESGNEIEVDFK